jgi:trk system potassium uptake protein
MNLRLVSHILSYFILVLGGTMVLPLGVAIWYGEADLNTFAYTGSALLVLGFILSRVFRSKGEPVLKDGFLIVTFAWVIFALGGALPFYFSGAIPSFVDAFFESMSGFTTTGASILTDIEALSHSMLIWRSFIQWLGGMGIVVFSIAILPLLGIGGMQLFKAEVPGPTTDKVTPRIKQTALILWGIYSLFTLLETVLLWLGSMSWFDAVNHAFTTMATGGFSTRNQSIAAYDSTYINLVIVFFMLLAGVNFTLHMRWLKGRFSWMTREPEFRFYIVLIALVTVLTAGTLILVQGQDVGYAFEHSLFTTVSLITTTGFGTADFNLWPVLIQFILIGLMFIGGMAGSTGGGIKVVRVQVLLKRARLELRRMVHPNAVLPVKLGQRIVKRDIVINITGFIILFLMIQTLATLVVAAFGYDMITSFSAVTASLSNIGPGLSAVGPTANYSWMHPVVKVVLSFCMLLGRLELFTVLVIMTRGFWRV